jgi:hypothetical protein
LCAESTFPHKRSSALVRDELEQRAVRVSEVHALPGAAGADAFDRARLELHTVAAQVLHRRLDRARPLEAEVAVPRPYRLVGDELADVGAGPVDVQPLLADRVGDAVRPERDDLGPEDVPVEGVRPLRVGDADDDVVETADQSSRSQ